MGWWKQLFSHKGVNKEEQPADNTEDKISVRRLRLEDTKERENYILACMEQMRMASDAMDDLNGEYNLVTTYLKDMEEVERLPENFSNQIHDYATKIQNLEKEASPNRPRKNRISQKQYEAMERCAGDMPQGYDKMVSAESYQKAVKSDMNRVEAEKQAYFYQENELMNLHANLRGVAIISLCAAFVCILMLGIMYLLLELDVRLGAILTVAAAVITLTVVFVKNQDAMKELLRVRKGIAKLIAMQNTIKIRYVNNTSLLEYLYMKFDVQNSNQLKTVWEAYLQEKVEREKYENARIDLDFYKQELLKVLQKLHIAYPQVWLYQTMALTDPKEMVEIRHGLILRRQQLRKQMDANRTMAEEAQSEIKTIALNYPKDSVKILRILEEYEKEKKS